MKITSSLALGVALTLCVGCASSTWIKPGTVEADFRIDNGQCRAQAMSATAGMTGFLGIAQSEAIREACLEGKGWQRSRS